MTDDDIGVVLQKIVQTMSLPKSPQSSRQTRAVLLAVERWLDHGKLPADIETHLKALGAWGDVMKPGILATADSADMPDDKRNGVRSYVKWIFTTPDFEALNEIAHSGHRTKMKLVKPAVKPRVQ